MQQTSSLPAEESAWRDLVGPGGSGTERLVVYTHTHKKWGKDNLTVVYWFEIRHTLI